MKIKLLIISVLIFLIIGSAGQAVKLEEINVDLHGSNKISDGQEDRFEVTDFNNNVYGGTLTVDEGDSYVCQAKANASPQDPRIRHGDYIKIWVDYEYFDSSDLYNGKVTFKLTLPDGQVKKKVIDDSFGLDNSVSGTLRGTFRADPDTAYTYTISAERNGEKSAKDSDVIQTIQPIKFSEQTEKSKEVYVDLNGSNKTSDRKEDRFEVTDLNNDVDGGTLTINEGDFYVVQAKVVPQDPRIRPGDYINISVNYEYIDTSDHYNGKVTFKLTLPNGQIVEEVIDDSFGLDNSETGTLRGTFKAYPDQAYTYTISAERTGETKAKDSETIWPINVSPCNT